jgi:hypothetical protein
VRDFANEKRLDLIFEDSLDGYSPRGWRTLMTKREWEKPRFTDLEMNAEIGGYQGDDSDGNVPVVKPAQDDSTARSSD